MLKLCVSIFCFDKAHCLVMFLDEKNKHIGASHSSCHLTFGHKEITSLATVWCQELWEDRKMTRQMLTTSCGNRPFPSPEAFSLQPLLVLPHTTVANYYLAECACRIADL